MKSPYDQIANEWIAARRLLRPKEENYLSTLLETADQRLPVLDLGCGSGTPIATFLTRAGYQVVGVDRSELLLAAARSTLPQAEWIKAEMENVEFEQRFGAVVCWDALFHLERSHHQPLLRKIHRWLAPGGRLMVSSGGSAHPPFTDKMWNHEFFYDSHAPEEMPGILGEAGFRIVLLELAEAPGGGRNKGKLAIIAEKPAPSTPVPSP